MLKLLQKLEDKLRNEYKEILINDQVCFELKNGVIIHAIGFPSCNALAVEYSDDIDAANMNDSEDGDMFYVEDYESEDELFDDIIREIRSEENESVLLSEDDDEEEQYEEENEMWRIKLNKLLRMIKKEYGDEVNPGIKGKDLAALEAAVEKELHKKLPKEYISVLKIVNGFNENGVFFYGCDEEYMTEEIPEAYGIIENNLDIDDEELLEKYLVLGEADDMDCYVYDVNDGRYKIIDPVDGTVLEECESFDKFMTHIIDYAIGE